MRRAGLVVGQTLELLRGRGPPRGHHRRAGRHRRGRHPHRRGDAVVPRLRPPGFPASICTSVNDEVVHGIPGDRVLRDGDLVSLDCGAIVDGWHGDAAITVPVGEVAPDVVAQLMRGHRGALWRGHRRCAARRPGQRHLRSGREPRARGRGPLRDPRGLRRPRHRHGDAPAARTCPTSAAQAAGPRWSQGMALAVEPMVTLGGNDTDVLDDDWTVVTATARWAAHVEHTFALTDRRRVGADRGGRRRGGADRLGVPFGAVVFLPREGSIPSRGSSARAR